MSQKVEIEIFECSERLPDEDVWVFAFHALQGWMSLKRSSPKTGTPLLLWESEDGPLSYQDEVVIWFVQPERPKPISKHLYLTCKNGTKLTIPDDGTINRLGAPWHEIFNNSDLLSPEAYKYVTYSPPVYDIAEFENDDDDDIVRRLNELESRIEILERRDED